MKKILIILLIIAISAVKVFAAGEEVDYLGVAAVLIRDGNYSRAEKSLKQVDLAEEGLDIGRYYTLKGLVELRKPDNEAALSSFYSAVDAGVVETVIWAYIAQAHYAIGEYQQTIDAIDKLPSINQFPDLYGVKSQSYWSLDDTAKAFSVIETGINRFPAKTAFLHQKIYYLVELDLNQTAVEESLKFLEMEGSNNAEAYLTIAEALRSGNEAKQAAVIMEIAKLKFPDNQRVRLMMAQCYMDAEMPLTAASIVEEASYYDPSFTKDAAELYRQAGDLYQAEYLNSLLNDQTEKTRLRFNLLIDKQEFEEALALEPRLKRTGLLQDENMIYAMAYVMFQVQRYDTAIEYINQITSSDLFRQATKLRQAIEIMKSEEHKYF